MTEPYADDSVVIVLNTEGTPIAEGRVLSHRKTLKRDREARGEYEYFVSGNGYSAWEFSNYVRPKL